MRAARIRGVAVPRHRGIGEGSAISRHYGYTDDEGSAHSGGTSCVGRQGWVRAAPMQSVPSRVCGTMRDIKRRRDNAVKIMRLWRGIAHDRWARQHPLSRGSDIQPMAVELDPFPMGIDIQPILVGQASTRCHGDKDGCEQKNTSQ